MAWLLPPSRLALARDPGSRNLAGGSHLQLSFRGSTVARGPFSSTGDDSRLDYLYLTMTSLMIPAILAFLLILFGMPSLIMVAKRKHLVDEPTESRKLHHRSVPTVGGVMLFASTLCASLVSLSLIHI